MKLNLTILNLLLVITVYGQYGEYKLQPQVVKLNQKGTNKSNLMVQNKPNQVQVNQQVQSQPQYNQPNQSSLPVFNPITINLQKCDIRLVEKVWVNLIESYQEKVLREKTSVKQMATNLLSKKTQSNLIQNCLIPEIGGTTYLDVSFEIREGSLTFSVTPSQAQYSSVSSSFGSADNLIQTFLKELKTAILNLQIANQEKRGETLIQADKELTLKLTKLQTDIDKSEARIYKDKTDMIELEARQVKIREDMNNNKAVLNNLQESKRKIQTEHVNFF